MRDSKFLRIQELLQQRADLHARLNLLPYDGSPEVKEQSGNRYIYIRKRIGNKLTSKYVDIYTDVLYQMLLRNSREAREIRKSLRHIDKELAEHGYSENKLSPRVVLNIDFARVNMKLNIYDQAILEGVATSFPQTEDIIDNGKVYGMTATDVQKILNLKHAWEFILDNDVIQCSSNYHMLCHIAKIVNEGFYDDGGRIRGVPVTIGGTSYIPPLPIETIVMERLQDIMRLQGKTIDIAVRLCLYCMKTQIFNDGNKRTAVIFANHYLISQGAGLIVIPEKYIPKFRKLLVAYYEGKNNVDMVKFMIQKCWKQF